MKDAVSMLEKAKMDIDNMEAPDEFESRLNNALAGKKTNRAANLKYKVKAAAAIIALFFILYNFDTFAYYGKKLVGYENIMNGTLSHLNELGKGQNIDKSYKFKNGTVIVLDGVMLDSNQLLAFITVKLNGNTEDFESFHFEPWVKGTFGNYLIRSSVGNINADKSEIKYICTIDTPHFFDNNMKISFSTGEDNYKDIGEIDFRLDRSKAMGYVLRENIQKDFCAGKDKISINSISASPVSTVINGRIQSLTELVKDEISGERIRPNGIDLRLIADGKELSSQGSGMSTDMNGITFHCDYDAIPDDIKKLELKLASFSADHDVKEQIELVKGKTDKRISILGQEIIINKIYEYNGDTCVTFTSDDNVRLTKVKLVMDGKEVKLENTDSDEYEKTADGKVKHTRTMHFTDTGEKLQLKIQSMTYSDTYNQIINIPVK